ncbi:MAG: histidinol dehydrogenase [Ruminococcus sp.]|jgi:histidinol dehydrogenase|nr:histidinol dehydrogenase [Ruminococcus sp.]
MIKKIKADGKKEVKFINELQRRNLENKDVHGIVTEIIENVKNRGDDALREYAKKFDNLDIEDFEVFPDLDKADEKLTEALLNAIENISEYHRNQIEKGFSVTKENGIMLGQRVRGLHSVGLYVPGGTAAYPSSVLMNAVPAKIAGVEEIIVVTPKATNEILTACALCGVDRVFQVGGAQAIAALSFGTKSIPKVDKIVGPGNIFVTTAKKLLFGTVDIDMTAGPSEILILADENANPKYIAADLMSQAEHDILASSVLITTDEKVADETIKELELQIKNLSRKDIIEKSLSEQGAIIVCESMAYAVELANLVAPEHLEVLAENPFEYIGRLDNAGSVFLGEYSPEPLGDYYAGPNHVLPTSGTAKFFSPLSVSDFYKKSSYIFYPKSELMNASEDIITIAETEGLTAHANSIKVRTQN